MVLFRTRAVTAVSSHPSRHDYRACHHVFRFQVKEIHRISAHGKRHPALVELLDARSKLTGVRKCFDSWSVGDQLYRNLLFADRLQQVVDVIQCKAYLFRVFFIHMKQYLIFSHRHSFQFGQALPRGGPAQLGLGLGRR